MGDRFTAETAHNVPKKLKIANPEGGHFVIYRWGTVGAPAILFHHATGFTGLTWDLVAGHFSSEYSVYAMDVRGHGTTSLATVAPSWQLYGEDLAFLARQLASLEGLKSFRIGVGHSLGGTAMMIASQIVPGLLPQLAVIEPVVLPDSDEGGRTRFSIRTRMRQKYFSTRVEALRAFSDDPVYGKWDRQILKDFVRSAMVDEDDGTVRLACDPELEASIYELGATPKWRPDNARTLAILGSRTSRFYSGYVEIKGSGTIKTIGDFGHLVPMENPGTVIRWLQRELTRQGLS